MVAHSSPNAAFSILFRLLGYFKSKIGARIRSNQFRHLAGGWSTALDVVCRGIKLIVWSGTGAIALDHQDGISIQDIASYSPGAALINHLIAVVIFIAFLLVFGYSM